MPCKRDTLSAVAALAAVTAAPTALGFALDGVLGSDPYSVEITVPFVVDGGSVASADGKLHVGREATGNRDIFLLLEVPTSLKDLTYGANQSPNYPSDHAYSRAQGSEKWVFSLSGSDVELKLKHINDTTGHDLTKNGGGAVLAGRTSLDWNMSQFDFTTPANNPGAVDLQTDSPPCGTGLGTDADCYANPAPGFEAYEFAQLYELQIDGSLYDAGLDLATFGSFISAASVHASPNKADGNNQIDLICTGSNPNASLADCPTNGGTPPGNVPEPPALVLLALGLLGVVVSRARGEGRRA